jgi:hypothetical protein
VRPTGEVTLSRPGGPALATATLTGAVLLPGAARALDGGLWTRPALAASHEPGLVSDRAGAVTTRGAAPEPGWPVPVASALLAFVSMLLVAQRLAPRRFGASG